MHPFLQRSVFPFPSFVADAHIERSAGQVLLHERLFERLQIRFDDLLYLLAFHVNPRENDITLDTDLELHLAQRFGPELQPDLGKSRADSRLQPFRYLVHHRFVRTSE